MSKDPCERLGQFFEWKHLPTHLQEPSMRCQELYEWMLGNIPHNAELTVGIRKLLEAKDCFVRAKLYKEE